MAESVGNVQLARVDGSGLLAPFTNTILIWSMEMGAICCPHDPILVHPILTLDTSSRATD